MDIEELKRTISDLEFALGKLESLENLGEITEQLDGLEKNLIILKTINLKNLIFSGFIGLIIGGAIGLFSMKSYQNYKTKAINDFKNIAVYEDNTNSYLYIPNTYFEKQNKSFIIFKNSKK